jgi:hypothetical protein
VIGGGGRAGDRWSCGKSNHIRQKFSCHTERRKKMIGDAHAMRGGGPENAQNSARDLESSWFFKTKITVRLSSFRVYQRRKCTTTLYFASKREIECDGIVSRGTVLLAVRVLRSST